MTEDQNVLNGYCTFDGIVRRESKSDNDLFYICSLIEYIGRKTHNKRADVINVLGKDLLFKVYDLADVYHCENIDKVSDELIEESNLQQGDFDNVGDCEYDVPTFWDIGRVRQRLVLGFMRERNMSVIDALFEVYNNQLCDVLDNYNCSFYFEGSDKQLYCFLNNVLL